MGRRLLVVLGAVLATAIVGVTPIAAGEDAGGTYLSLGDSVAAGTQQPQPFASNGYADQLFKGLRDDYGFDKLVNLACPGDDTVWMRFGIGGVRRPDLRATGHLHNSHREVHRNSTPQSPI